MNSTPPALKRKKKFIKSLIGLMGGAGGSWGVYSGVISQGKMNMKKAGRTESENRARE